MNDKARLITWVLALADRWEGKGSVLASHGACERCGGVTPYLADKICNPCVPEVLREAAQLMDPAPTAGE